MRPHFRLALVVWLIPFVMSEAGDPSKSWIQVRDNSPIASQPTDAKSWFDAAFVVPAKDKFETTNEFIHRIEAAGLTNQTVYFLVSKRRMEIEAFPEQSTYLVHTKNSTLMPFREPPTLLVGIGNDVSQPAKFQNEAGAKFDGTILTWNEYAVLITNFDGLPEGVFLTPYKEFGVPIKDPDPDLLRDMREGKLRLLLKFAVGDFPHRARTTYTSGATLSHPVETRSETLAVPGALIGMAIVSGDPLIVRLRYVPPSRSASER